jgi:hypothetical protein
MACYAAPVFAVLDYEKYENWDPEAADMHWICTLNLIRSLFQGTPTAVAMKREFLDGAI